MVRRWSRPQLGVQSGVQDGAPLGNLFASGHGLSHFVLEVFLRNGILSTEPLSQVNFRFVLVGAGA